MSNTQDRAASRNNRAGSGMRALLLPHEPRPVISPAQIALSELYLLPVLSELEAFFLALRGLVDPQLAARQPVKLGKPYPVGQCLEITLVVQALLNGKRMLSLSGPAAAGQEAFHVFRRAGGLFRQVWGDLRGEFFQNAFQLGTLYVDVSNDTVMVSKPKVEILPFDAAGLVAVADFHHFARLAARYWKASFYPNHVVPALAPWCPLIQVSAMGDVTLCDLTQYMAAVATVSAFRASEDVLQGEAMPQALFDHIVHALGNAGMPPSPAEGRRLALHNCREARRCRWHAMPEKTRQSAVAVLKINRSLTEDFRDRGPFGGG